MRKIATIRNIEDINKLKRLGIDCVLIGEKNFSSSIEMLFNLSEINEIVKHCHDLNMEVIVCLNRLYFDDDLNKLSECINELVRLNVDYIEYTDPCVYMICSGLNCLNKLIYNPDALMCNNRDIQTYLDLSINSVVISKEITIDEIEYISNNTNGKLQLHVFGNIRMSYTKRRLISNYLSELNKDIAINNSYEVTLIESTRTGVMPIIEDDYSTSVYSDFVMCGLLEIKKIKDMNIDSIRFDGIFLKQSIFFDVIEVFNQVISNEIDEEVAFKMLCEKYSDLNITDGYLNTKTNLVK